MLSAASSIAPFLETHIVELRLRVVDIFSFIILLSLLSNAQTVEPYMSTMLGCSFLLAVLPPLVASAAATVTVTETAPQNLAAISTQPNPSLDFDTLQTDSPPGVPTGTDASDIGPSVTQPPHVAGPCDVFVPGSDLGTRCTSLLSSIQRNQSSSHA